MIILRLLGFRDLTGQLVPKTTGFGGFGDSANKPHNPSFGGFYPENNRFIDQKTLLSAGTKTGNDKTVSALLFGPRFWLIKPGKSLFSVFFGVL